MTDSWRIHYLYCEYTTISLSTNSLLIYNRLRELFFYLFPFSRFHYFVAKALWIHNRIIKKISKINKFTILFEKSLWIHNVFREFPLNSLVSWNYYEFHYLICKITMTSLSVTRMRYRSIVFFTNSLSFNDSLWIYYLFRELTWNHYIFREKSNDP